MAATLATVTDFAAHLQRDLDDADTYTADQALRIASGLIRSYLGVTLDGVDPVPEDIRGVCLDLAARRFNNPTGLTSETILGYSYTQAPAGQGVGLTIEEKAILDTSGYARARVYTVGLA